MRSIPSIFVVLALLSLAVPSLGQTVVVDVDPTFPSGGSGAPIVFSGGGLAEVVLDTSDPGPAPLSLVAGAGPKTPTPTLTFTGMTQAPSLDGGFLYKPPDTHHAVGTGAGAAGRVVHVTNSGVRIFDKTGTSIAGPLDLDAFLTALGAAGLSGSGAPNLGFDPKVIFDQHSGRFFIVILDGRTPGVRSNVQIATSKTATPGTLTTADWTVETASALTTFTGGDSWFDYPGIGADATRLVVTGNMFTAAGGFVGTKVRVFLKGSLTDNGMPAGAIFNDIDVDASSTSGISTAQPAHVFGSTLNGDFYLINRFGSTAYRQWQITGAGGSASLVAGSPSLHGWTAGAFLGAGAPQTTDGLNDEPTIDTLSARVQNAVYRNDAGNTDSIWLTLTSDPDSDSQAEVVWFEIDPNSANSTAAGTLTTPSINQSGSIDGSTAADWTYMPSISVNGVGAAIISYSESNGSKAVQHRSVGRSSSDAAGTFQAPVLIATGAGEYDDFSNSNPERWGDYSAAVVDPDDDATFWVSNEISQTAATSAGDDGRWGTRIARLGVPCTVVVLANDTITGTQVFLGSSVTLGPNLVVNGTSIEIQAATTVTFVNDTEIGGSFSAGTGFPCPAGPALSTLSEAATTQPPNTAGNVALLLDGLRTDGRFIAGESVTLKATASGQVLTVDFLANGALLATDTSPPFELLFTAPSGVPSVTFSVVVHDGVGNAVPSSPVIVPIDPDLLATVRGRVVDAQGLPVTGAVVNVLSEGLQAEYFDFTASLREMPDLVGLTPDRVTRVTALNLRNPNGIFGVDPLGIPPIAPDYAARFTGWLTVPVAGTYTFFLGADEGARLRVGGVVIADIPGDQNRYQEVPATVDLQAGLVPIDVIFYESVGSAELQLSWALPNMERQVIAPDSLVPALRPFVTITDANGFFSVADVPSALDDVRVQATVAEPSLSSVTSTNLSLTGGQAVDVGDLVIP